MPPQQLGPYRIVQVIGEGGMASAYLAQHETLQKLVVLKVIAPEFSNQEAYRHRFLLEARTLAKLAHPNIVQVFDARVEGDLCFMALEYVEGRDLQSRFQDADPIPLPEFLRILGDVCNGLQAVHEAGLVHRDIKPANILVTKNGTAKITDFGIALETSAKLRLTRTGILVGTPHYVSPEQALDAPIDGRSDLYSLGVILFEGIARRPVFETDSPTALLVKHVQEAPPALDAVAPGTPKPVAEVARRLLAKKPEDRYRSAKELRETLDTILAQPPSAKPVESPRARRKTGPHPVRTLKKKPPVAMIAGGIAGGVLFLILALALARVFSSTPPAVNPNPETKSNRAATDEKKEGPKPGTGINLEDGRRQVDSLVCQVNHAAIAAAYCDLKGMKAEAQQLRNMMTSNEEKLQQLLVELKTAGIKTTPGDRLADSDRILNLDGHDLGALGKEPSIAILGTFVAQIKAGSRARIIVGRGSEKIEIDVRFEEKPPELHMFIQIAGLIPGQKVEAKAETAQVESKDPKVEPKIEEKTPEKPEEKKPERKLLAVPAEEDQKKAEMLIRDIFKEEYAKSSPSDRVSLAERLLQEARDTHDDPVARFVLLLEARDLAAQAGTVSLALAAVEELSKEYDVDVLPMRQAVLTSAEKNARTSSDMRSLALAFLTLVEEAVHRGDLASAEKAAASALSLAKKAKDFPLVSKADARVKEVAEMKSRYEKVRKAEEDLRKNPGDASANATVGKYHCLVRGDWVKGLSLLAKGNDPALQAQAKKDMARPVEAMDQMAVGDGWWEIASKQTGIEQEQLRKRAGYWYAQAVDGLTGLQKTKVEKRLADSGVPRGVREEWIDITDPGPFGLGGKPGDPIVVPATPGSGKLVVLDKKMPQGEFDGLSVRCRFADRWAQAVVMFEYDRRTARIDASRNLFHVDSIDDKLDPLLTVKIEAKDEYLITVLVVDGEYVAYLDEVEMGRIPTTERRIAMIGLQASHHPITYTDLRLRRKK